MLEHGGGILQAAHQYQIAVEDWVDLSTGLNPQGWPAPSVPASAWLRLPESPDALEAAAQQYYGASHLLAVAGSQASIQALPRLRTSCRVGVLEHSYAEHGYQWQQQGHTVLRLPEDNIANSLAELDVLLLCHPNNPTGRRFEHQQLISWQQQLSQRGGWLIIDEAFIDATPEHSLLKQSGAPGLIILRSVGKFFGLAGARVGFVFAWPALLTALANELGPWTINGPARWVVSQALLDHAWQHQARQQLPQHSQRLATCLRQAGLTISGSTAFFHWLQDTHSHELHCFLAQRGILTRYFAASDSIRFGLPGMAEEWFKLEQALSEWQTRNA